MTKKRGITQEATLSAAISRCMEKEDMTNRRNSINDQKELLEYQKELNTTPVVSFGVNVNININIDSDMTSNKLNELLDVVKKSGF